MDAQSVSDTRLYGAQLIIARVLWVALAVATLALFAAGIPAYFDELLREAAEYHASLAQLSLSPHLYAGYHLALDFGVMLGFSLTGAVIFWRKPADWLTMFVALMLVTFGVLITTPIEMVAPTSLAWNLLLNLVYVTGAVSSLVCIYIFPDGRFIPRWTRPLAVGFAVWMPAWRLFPEAPFSPHKWPLPLVFLVYLGWYGTGLYAQIYRYVRVSNATQRQQTKWFVFGLAMALPGSIMVDLPDMFLPALRQPGLPSLLYALVSKPFYYFAMLLIPLSFGIAILRYRLWDIDIVINRTLVYSTLSALLVGGYMLLIVILGRVMTLFVGYADNAVVTMLATASTAVAFLPARQGVQRAIDRAFYRDKLAFRRNVAAFNTALAQVTNREELETLISTTLPQSLRLQGARLNDPVVSATTALMLPLTFAGGELGVLKLEKKLSGQLYNREETELLRQLAQQVAVAVANVQLTETNKELEAQKKAVERARVAEQQALQREMNLARDIQTSLLPPTVPHIAGIETAGLSIPAREVGGDFYNYYELPQNSQNPRGGYVIAVGDVSGKGIPAALYMAVSTTILTAKGPFVPDVAQLMSQINVALYPYIAPNRMNTALCCVRLEPPARNEQIGKSANRQPGITYTAHIANAGLIAPILRRGAQCQYLDVSGLPLGMTLTAPPYHALKLSLQAGDILVLSSDGVVEAMNAAGEMYGLDRLAARVASAPSSAAKMIDWIITDVQAYVGSAEQHDDMTIVVTKVE